jgi:hypothetical protein
MPRKILAAAIVMNMLATPIYAAPSREVASRYCLKVTQTKYPDVTNIFHDDDAAQFYYACLGSLWAHGIPKDKNDPRMKLFGIEPPN